MKLAALALVALVSLVDSAQVAEACGRPEPTCGEEFCSGAIGVMEATIVSPPTTENFETSVVIHVTSGWGMTDGIPAGSDRTLETTQIFRQEDVGKSFVLYLVRNSDGDLSIQRGVDLAEYQTTKCFGDDVTAEKIATIVLADDCDITLTPGGPSSGGCPDDTCNAGGAAGGSPIALTLAGLVARRRRRRLPTSVV